MNLPTELTQAIKMPWTAKLPSWAKLRDATIQKVIVLEIPAQSINTQVCANCSGSGWIYAFLVIGGPHPHVYSGANIASKWIDDAWLYGFTNAYACPDCSGDSMEHILEYDRHRTIKRQATGQYDVVEMFVEHIVEVFREVKRVLRDQARARLGLDKLDAWRNGRHKVDTKLEGLPMFECAE